jgi:hypothetical protein
MLLATNPFPGGCDRAFDGAGVQCHETAPCFLDRLRTGRQKASMRIGRSGVLDNSLMNGKVKRGD